MKRGSVPVMMATGVACFYASSLARAGEVLQFREIMHAASVQSQDVGDVEGHVFSVGRFYGLASFPDGSVATAYFTVETNYVKGSGTALVYSNLTLQDGSVLWFKVDVTTRLEGATTRFLESPVTVLSGNGRFEGATGQGTVSGGRLGPLATGANNYLDVTINVKK